jgi:hypothetical protein
MIWFEICSALALYMSYGRAEVASTHESPHGLTFTPTTVIASRFNASDSVELTKAPLGSAYREFYQQSVQTFDPSIDNDSHIDRSEIASLFRTTVVPATEHFKTSMVMSLSM